MGGREVVESADDRSFDAFLDAMPIQESWSDPRRFSWSLDPLDEPVVGYPAVPSPGVPARDFETGALRNEHLTVRRYFGALGVIDLFDPSEPDSLARMRYVTDAPGFVGYQFGEAILLDTGHYEPERVVHDGEERLESYFVGGIPESAWSGGCIEVSHRLDGGGRKILATDRNRWRAAHLAGPYGALDLLLAGGVAEGEFGTSIRTYFDTLAGFEVPDLPAGEPEGERGP